MDFVSEARTPKPLPGYGGGTGIKRNLGNIKRHFDDRESAALVAQLVEHQLLGLVMRVRAPPSAQIEFR